MVSANMSRESIPRAMQLIAGGLLRSIIGAKAASDEKALSHYRRVRDAIKEFVPLLPGVLSAEPAGAGDA